MRRGAQERVALGVIIGGFAIGCFTHAMDFWWFGWAPYRFGPPVLNAFWNSLVLLDAAVIVLLARGRRRAGLVLACAVMLGDVAANSYAWGVLGLSEFAPALVAQTGFLGFMLGSGGFLWPREAPSAMTVSSHERHPHPSYRATPGGPLPSPTGRRRDGEAGEG